MDGRDSAAWRGGRCRTAARRDDADARALHETTSQTRQAVGFELDGRVSDAADGAAFVAATEDDVAALTDRSRDGESTSSREPMHFETALRLKRKRCIGAHDPATCRA